MELKAQIIAYLNENSDHPLSRRYFEPLFDLLIALDLPTSEANGFACMAVLGLSKIELSDGRIIGDESDAQIELMGSIEDRAVAISVVFSEINSNSIWWKSGYPVRAGDADIRESVELIMKKLQMLDFVKNIETIIPF